MATWGSLKKFDSIPENRYGFGQGYFRFYRADGTYEAIVAVGGRLIREGGDLPIEGLPDGFQKTRQVEAVQWKDRLFIATGTKLVEYDGLTAKVVEEYKPKPLEAIYIGLNGLAEFPDDFMDDGINNFLRIDGLIPSLRKGVAQTSTTFSTFISKPGTEEIEYKYEYRMAERESFVLGKDWSASKTWDFTPKEIGDYTIKVSARVVGTPDEPASDSPEVFQIPKYPVTAFDENEAIDASQMHTCNRILLHWERLIVYGDEKNSRTVYVSHLKNPRYFPINHSLEFENNEQEPLQKLVQFRDMLVAFLPSSIQAVYGKSPVGDDIFRRIVIHTGLGCVAPETPKVMGNYIAFLSKEGVHVLKSVGMNNDQMNVEKIDANINNLIPVHTNAAAIVYDDQYQICFPDINQRFRFYYQYGVWTMDESPFLDGGRFYEWNGELIMQSAVTGRIYMFADVYNDVGYVYEDRVVTKAYDFGEPHNPKKAKELQLVLGRENHDINLSVNVNIDDNPIFTTNNSFAQVVNGEVQWEEEFETNVSVDAGTVFGYWDMGESEFDQGKTKLVKIPLSGKGRTVSVDIRHREDSPNAILGAGFIFKVKKP